MKFILNYNSIYYHNKLHMHIKYNESMYLSDDIFLQV